MSPTCFSSRTAHYVLCLFLSACCLGYSVILLIPTISRHYFGNIAFSYSYYPTPASDFVAMNLGMFLVFISTYFIRDRHPPTQKSQRVSDVIIAVIFTVFLAGNIWVTATRLLTTLIACLHISVCVVTILLAAWALWDKSPWPSGELMISEKSS